MMAGATSAKPILAILAANPNVCVTLDELDAALPHDRKVLSPLLCRLITDKYVVRRERGCFQVTSAGIAADRKGYRPGPQRESRAAVRKPRESTLQQRMWKTLRIMRRSSVPELVALSARGNERNAAANIQAYLKTLEKFGYVQKLKKKAPGTAPSSTGFAIWLLLKDTGPTAPGWYWRKRELFDRNTGERIKLGGDA